MAPGSRKDLGCFYIVGKNVREMALCESAIDAASNFDPKAVSSRGAKGLMQLMPGDCKD